MAISRLLGIFCEFLLGVVMAGVPFVEQLIERSARQTGEFICLPSREDVFPIQR